MNSKSKVPQIRFKGFSGEWEEKKFGELAEVRRGLTYKPTDVNDNGVKVLRSSNILDDTFVNNKDDVYVNEEAINIKYIAEHDILITSANGSSRLVGKHAIIQNLRTKTVHGGFMLLVSSKNPFFLNSSMSSSWYNKFINKYVSGGNGAIGNLSKNDLEEQYIYVPETNEQTKIGNYFQHLDKLIEQKEKKYQKLRQFKKAMLDRMFPKNGVATPEIRFKGFSGEWEEKELDEIVNRYDNLRVPISATNRVSGNTPYYGANGIQGYVKGYTHDGEFILVAEDGANDLKNYPVQYVNGKIWVNNHTHVLQAKKDVTDNGFLKFAISKINIEPFLVGGGRAKLNANIMMKININVPSEINEQTKIGNYFQHLDKLINLHLQEMKKLKNIKKASLEKMFV
ncbi:MAG: restriction endonuclease subunit S [Sulfurovaceae bacterium]